MSWRDKQFIGLSIQRPKELKRITALNLVNMVEIKVQQFSQAGFPLYLYRDGYFYPDDKALKKLSFELCDGLEAVQFHLTMGGSINPKIESGLNIGVIEHHEIYLRMFQMFEEMYGNRKIGSVLTLHPPLFKAKKRSRLSEEEAAKNAKIFFAKLDELRISANHQTKIGLENMPDPNSIYGIIGYLPAHFRTMLWDTRSIGVTIDTGHRRLADDFKVSEFIRLGFEVVNCHFQGNRGKSNSNSLNDDIHEFPHGRTESEEENVYGYKNCIRYFRRHRTPVVLEISNLGKYSDEKLIEKVERIKRDLE